MSSTYASSSTSAASGQARVAMVDAAHAVEEMGRGRAAGRIAGLGLLEGRRGVAHGRRDAAVAQPGDELERTGDLRGDRDQAQAVEVRLQLVVAQVGRGSKQGRVVRAPLGVRQPRALPGSSRAAATRRRAPRASSRGPRPTNRYRSSSGADTPVGRNDVTPWRRRCRAIPSSAARPPIASWPPPPWTWTSTKPGAMYGRRRRPRCPVGRRRDRRDDAVLDGDRARLDGVVEDQAARDRRHAGIGSASVSVVRLDIGGLDVELHLQGVPVRRVDASRSPRSAGRGRRR